MDPCFDVGIPHGILPPFQSQAGGDTFSTAGDWTGVSYDCGEWQAAGPFHHDWGPGWHERSGIGGEARWAIGIAATGTHGVSAW